MSKAIIDADSMVYILAWDVKELAHDYVGYNTVIDKTDQFVHNILQAAAATEYVGFLKGYQPTFRHLANPDYKANRQKGTNAWLATWGPVIEHRLIRHWKFDKVEGMEAEDAVSMTEKAFRLHSPVICHIDKDLNQIPGNHYNYKKQTMYVVTPEEALMNLFKQVLIGDATDNLPGLPGIGESKANQLITADTDPLWAALSAFIRKFGEREGILKFAESYSMVKLLVEPELGFEPLRTAWNPYTPPAVEKPELGEPPDFINDDNLFKL